MAATLPERRKAIGIALINPLATEAPGSKHYLNNRQITGHGRKMEETVMLTALALFSLLAAVCSIVFNKFKLPPLIGYIIAGIVLVNVMFLYQGEETIMAEEQIISFLKDFGLVLLMFCIGLEINIKKIRKQGSFAILVVVILLPLMLTGGFVAGTLLGYDMTQSLVLGAIISGSSSAVLLAVLKTQNKLDRDHVDMLILVAIMEDIGQVIILSMITPLMANYAAGAMGGMDLNEIIVLIIKILAFMVVSIVVGLRIVPRIINWISDNVSDEILTVASVGLAFLMALLATYAGLSMAIGAFLMGMMVASSRKAKDINSKIGPMRDLFMAVFFISIGAEVYPASILVDNIGTILIFFVIYFVLMTCNGFLAYWIGNETCRNGFLSAINLCAMGEFAFIIAAEALADNVIDNGFYTSVIGAALLSMITLPIVSRYAGSIWDGVVSKCPRPIYAACCSLNDARSRTYDRLSASSKKSQKAVYRSMTHAYINILVIAAIEIAFYFLTPPLSGWLLESFGWNQTGWVLMILGVNFLFLTIPTYYMINNVKFLDEIIIGGAKRIANREGRDSNPVAMYERFLNFLDINTYLLIVLIDFLIILIVPNAVEVELWYYAAIIAVAALAILVLYVRKRRQIRTEMAGQDQEEDQRSSPDHPARLYRYRRGHVACELHGRGGAGDDLLADVLLLADDIHPMTSHILQDPLHGGRLAHGDDAAEAVEDMGVGAPGEPQPVPPGGGEGVLVGFAGHAPGNHLVRVEAPRHRWHEDALADADLDALVGVEVSRGMGG